RRIEPPIAALAAQVQEPVGLAWMEKSLLRARQQVAERDDALWLTNLDIHRAVAATSGNGVLAEVLDSIVLIHADSQREILRLHGDAVEDYDEHARLVAAVREGRSEDAKAEAHRHLEEVAAIVQARL